MYNIVNSPYLSAWVSPLDNVYDHKISLRFILKMMCVLINWTTAAFYFPFRDLMSFISSYVVVVQPCLSSVCRVNDMTRTLFSQRFQIKECSNHWTISINIAYCGCILNKPVESRNFHKLKSHILNFSHIFRKCRSL